LLAEAHSYAQVKTTPEVIKTDLGLSPEEFVRSMAWLDKRAGKRRRDSMSGERSWKALVELDKARTMTGCCGRGRRLWRSIAEYVAMRMRMSTWPMRT